MITKPRNQSLLIFFWTPLLTSMILALLLGCTSAGYPPQTWDAIACSDMAVMSPVDPTHRQAARLVEQALSSDRGAGISAAVMIDGKLVWSTAVGAADRRTDVDLTTATKMRLGSVSKPFTATIALRLHEEGVLDLDSPIQSYVPSFPDKGVPITIRQLLSHSAGLRQYDFSSLSESNSRVQYDRLAEALPVFADDPLLFEPGEDYHYSSFGYNLVGAAIENVLDLSFADALQHFVVEPLGLSGTAIDDPNNPVGCRADFYTVVFGWLPIRSLWRNHSDSYSSAGMLSTAQDLVVFANALFGGDFYKPETRQLITEAVKIGNDELLNRSLVWEIGYDDDGDVQWYGHGGTTNGAYASIRYYPEKKMAVAGIANYNYWLTNGSPEFFQAIREQLPALFGRIGIE